METILILAVAAIVVLLLWVRKLQNTQDNIINFTQAQVALNANQSEVNRELVMVLNRNGLLKEAKDV